MSGDKFCFPWASQIRPSSWKPLDLSDLAGFLATLALYMLSQGCMHTHIQTVHPPIPPLSSPVYSRDPTWRVCCLDQCPWNPSPPAYTAGTARSGVCGSVHEGLPCSHGSASLAASQSRSELHSPLWEDKIRSKTGVETKMSSHRPHIYSTSRFNSPSKQRKLLLYAWHKDLTR